MDTWRKLVSGVGLVLGCFLILLAISAISGSGDPDMFLLYGNPGLGWRYSSQGAYVTRALLELLFALPTAVASMCALLGKRGSCGWLMRVSTTLSVLLIAYFISLFVISSRINV
jgi:hypothetical protein